MHKKSKRIAIIGCAPPDQKRVYKGKERTVGEAVAHLIMRKSSHVPSVHEPPENIKDFPDLSKTDAIIIPGSPYNLERQPILQHDWMKKLLDFIRSAHGKKPILGICFGHQAIAVAFGSTLSRLGDDVRIGIGTNRIRLTEQGRNDPLFDSMPVQFVAMFGHLFYVQDMPRDGILLARNEIVEIQGFKLGEKTYGVQFHPDYNTQVMSQIIKSGVLDGTGLEPDDVEIRHKLRHDTLVIDNFLKIAAMI